MISGLRVYSLIDLALTYLGVTAPGESIDPAIGRMALLSLNNMRNSWAGTLINQQRYDKRIVMPTQSYHISLGSYTPQDSTPVPNSKRIYVTIPLVQVGDYINIEIDGVDLTPIEMIGVPGTTTASVVASAINSASLGIVASVANPRKVLLVSSEDIGIYFSTSSPTNRGAYKYTGDFPIRPASIYQLTVQMGQINIPISIRAMAEYRQIPLTTVSVIPQAAFIESSYPIQNIYFYPGIASGYGVSILGHAYPREYERIDDNYIDAPELFKPMALYLACDLAPSFGQETSQSMLANAHSAVKHIKNSNFIENIVTENNDIFSIGSSYSIWSGM